MRRTSLVMYMGLIFLFWFGSADRVTADDDWQEIYDEAKAAFIQKFEQFKKDGLSAKQTKELLEQLKEVGGDEISGTGTEFLLNTMHQQTKNVISIMDKKETVEMLIEFVGDVYALSISDTPPDGVEAYRALAKGVPLLSKLADQIPVLRIVAVPMIDAYAQAIKNGEWHIMAIAASQGAKNAAIRQVWKEVPGEETLFSITELEIEEEEPLTEEELVWEALRVEERERNQACAGVCKTEDIAYQKAAYARNDAITSVQRAKKGLDEVRTAAETERLEYNHAVMRLNKYRQDFKKSLDKYNEGRSRMEQMQKEGNTEGEKFMKEWLMPEKKRLISWKDTLRADFDAVVVRQEKHHLVKVDAYQAKQSYESLLADYKEKNADFQKAYRASNDCWGKCLASVDSVGIECLAIIGGTEGLPLCVVSKHIVIDPEDDDLAHAVWTLAHEDGTPVEEGMEIPIHALLNLADGTPVGRGEMTYWGSKTGKDGLLIFHWDVSPDYRVVVKPANAEGSGATLTIEPQ